MVFSTSCHISLFEILELLPQANMKKKKKKLRKIFVFNLVWCSNLPNKVQLDVNRSQNLFEAHPV